MMPPMRPPEPPPPPSSEAVGGGGDGGSGGGGGIGGVVTVGTLSTVMPRAALAAAVVPRLVVIEAETAAKVEAGGTTMVAVMSTLAEAMVMVTYDGSTPAADAMLDARAVVSL